MRTVSLVMRIVLLLGPLTTFAGHVKVDEIATSTTELNRCLTAVRLALTRRGGSTQSASPARIDLERVLARPAI